jgi:hypothetical protein
VIHKTLSRLRDRQQRMVGFGLSFIAS